MAYWKLFPQVHLNSTQQEKIDSITYPIPNAVTKYQYALIYLKSIEFSSSFVFIENPTSTSLEAMLDKVLQEHTNFLNENQNES